MYGLTQSKKLKMDSEGHRIGREIRRTLNRDARARLFTELEQRVLDEAAPLIPLVRIPADYQPGIFLFNPSVQNAFDPVTGRFLSSSIYLESKGTTSTRRTKKIRKRKTQRKER